MTKNTILLHTAFVLLSIPALFAKGIDIPAGTLIWWRCMFGSVVALIILFFLKKLYIPKNRIGWVALTGVLMGLHWWAYFASIQYSTVAIGTLSLFTYPIIAVLLEPFFFKTRASKKQILGGVGIIGGVFFLIPELTFQNDTTVGVIVGVIAAILFAVRNLITRKYLGNVPTFTTMGYHILFAFLILTVPILVQSSPLIIPNRTETGLIFILATLFTLGSHGLLVRSLKYYTASTLGILASLQVLYSALLALLIFSEVPSTNFYIGAVIILGIALYEMRPAHKTNHPNK